MKMNSEKISNYLNELFPNPKCELNYSNDYELLLSIMLSAQTTDKRVNMCTNNLYKKYNSLDKLNQLKVNEIEDILRPLGSFRKKAIYFKEIVNILINEYDYKVPIERDKLEKLPGVGRKTANVFLSEFYNYPAIAVDTHVNRVSKRLNIASEEDSIDVVEKKLMKYFDKSIWARIHLQLVLFGRYHCKAIKPDCTNCKLKDICIEKKKD